MKTSTKTGTMAMISIMAAVMCVLGPLSIPIGPVPVSLTNFAIYIALYVLGTRNGTISVLIYLLIGLAGVPVFSGFTAGPAKLAGPTGGYLIGFLPMAVVAGFFIERYYNNYVVAVAGMFLATLIPYGIGSLWLAHSAGMTFRQALSAGVIPFVAEDLIKMILAAVIGPVLKKNLTKAL